MLYMIVQFPNDDMKVPFFLFLFGLGCFPLDWCISSICGVLV